MRVAILAFPLALLSCGRPSDPNPHELSTADAAPAFHKELLLAAREYAHYGRVDDETRWAPFLCRAPEPGRGRLSAASADSPHGRKLYYLFARSRPAYLQAGSPGFRQPPGQVIVKEAWVPEVSPQDVRPRAVDESSWPIGGAFVPYAARDGKLYHPARRAGLFLMLKTDPERAGTDQGWIYATASADGRTITASGRLASCMSCHEDAPGDRLFGFGGR